MNVLRWPLLPISFVNLLYIIAAIVIFAAILNSPHSALAQQEVNLSTPRLTARVSSSAVNLSWNIVSGATRYVLWVWDRTNGWKQIGGDNLTETSYVHTEVSPNIRYYFTVVATDGEGRYSKFSDYASVIIREISTPRLTARTVGNRIELSWTRVAEAAGYELFRWESSSSWQFLGRLTGTTYNQTGGIPNTVYYFTVRAVSSAGEAGNWSDFASAMSPVVATQTPSPGGPRPPGSEQGIDESSTSIPTATVTPTSTE